MNTGKYAAYKQLSPSNSDLSDVVVQQEKLNTAHQLRKDEKATKDREKKLASSKDLASINSGKQTKYLNYEHALTDAFKREGGLIEKYANAQARLETDPSDSEAAGIISNIKNTVKQIALTKDTMLKYHTELSKGIAEGTISKGLNKGYTSGMQRIIDGGINFDVDEYGGIKIMTTRDIDLDGDEQPDEITLESLTDKNNFGIWDKDFDLNEFSAGLDKNYKTYEKQTINPDGDNPYEKRIEKGFNEDNRLFLRDDMYAKFGEDVSSLTNAGKSYVLQNGLSLKEVKSNPELYTELIDDTTNKYIQTRQEALKNSVNFGAKNSDERLARQKSNSNKEKNTKNSLTTTVNGIIGGDNKYIKSLIGQKIEEQGSNGKDIIIRNAEKVGNELIVEMSDKSVRKIDLKDKNKSIAAIVALVRPNDKQDLRMAEYLKGEATETYEDNTAKSSKILIAKQINSLPETSKSHKLIPLLEKFGLKGFEDTGKTFGNTIKMPNGEEVDVDTADGMIALKKYLNENWDTAKGGTESGEVQLSTKASSL